MNHWAKLCSQSWKREELIGTHPFRTRSCAQTQPFSLSSPGQFMIPRQAEGMVSRKVKASNHLVGSKNRHFHLVLQSRWHPAQFQLHCEMGRISARTSTKATAALRDHRVPRACIGVPKFFGVVGLVGCLFTGRIIVGTPDGAPMVKRWHHLEKAATEIGTSPMANAWR